MMLLKIDRSSFKVCKSIFPVIPFLLLHMLPRKETILAPGTTLDQYLAGQLADKVWRLVISHIILLGCFWFVF